MKILITGCCGFIGFSFANYLAKSRKKIKIVGIDNLSSYYSVNLKKERLKILSTINADIKDNKIHIINNSISLSVI